MPMILDEIDNEEEMIFSPREKTLIHQLRVMLKDIPDDVYRSLNTLIEEQRGQRWSDMQLLVYLNQAIADINAEPALTCYTLEDFPEAWKACVINGGLVFSLIAEGVLQAGKILNKIFTNY